MYYTKYTLSQRCLNSRNNRPRQTGFSLLEMLIAFSLISLLFLALFTSFHTVARSWESAEKRMKKTEDRQLISTWLQQQLQKMVVLKLKPSIENPSDYSFSGEKQRLRFTAPLQPLQKKGGLYFIELFVYPTESSKQKHTLAMRYAPYRPDISWEMAFDAAIAVDIYQEFHGFSFTYLLIESTDNSVKWLDQWKDLQRYPRLLKISVEAPKSESWADIIIELPQVDDYLSTQHVPSKARNRFRSKSRSFRQP